MMQPRANTIPCRSWRASTSVSVSFMECPFRQRAVVGIQVADQVGVHFYPDRLNIGAAGEPVATNGKSEPVRQQNQDYHGG